MRAVGPRGVWVKKGWGSGVLGFEAAGLEALGCMQGFLVLWDLGLWGFGLQGFLVLWDLGLWGFGVWGFDGLEVLSWALRVLWGGLGHRV